MVRKKGRLVHIHSAKLRRCVKAVEKSKYNGKKYDPYAVCTASIGYKGSVLSAHRRK